MMSAARSNAPMVMPDHLPRRHSFLRQTRSFFLRSLTSSRDAGSLSGLTLFNLALKCLARRTRLRLQGDVDLLFSAVCSLLKFRRSDGCSPREDTDESRLGHA